MLSRRRFLALSAGAAGAVALPRGLSWAGGDDAAPPAARAGGAAVPGPGTLVAADAPAYPAFAVRMPVSPVLRPIALPDRDVYAVDIRATDVEVFPGVRTPALTFGGTWPGPTIRARQNRTTQVTYWNRLSEPANVHLHGAHVPASSDGHPMDLIAPGATRTYVYPNTQVGTTLWYHDHAHHLEAEHVYRGLHGAYVVEGLDERGLRLPDGAYDVPIVLRDAAFDAAGALDFTPRIARPTILANGKPQPYFPVAARKYRFRLVNASNQRNLTLSLPGAPIVKIGTDGGLLPAPVPVTEVTFGSAERVELVVDFSAVPLGTRLLLTDATAGPILAFDVTSRAGDPSRVPAALRPADVLPAATVTRDITLGFDLTGPTAVGLVNGVPFDPARVDVQVRRGTTEIWHVTNADARIPHTFHLHLVQFTVLERDGGAPLPQDLGRKDTVFLPPGGSVRVQATFGDYTGRYVYHCHYLEHSSEGMMAQVEVLP